MDTPHSPILPGVIYRAGRPSDADYDEAIEALRDAKRQPEANGKCCSVCHDSGHQAWECHHNPLVMARRAVMAARVWRCFHCNEIFTSYEPYGGKERTMLTEDEITKIKSAVDTLNDVLASTWEKYGDGVVIYPRTTYDMDDHVARVSVEVTTGRTIIR